MNRLGYNPRMARKNPKGHEGHTKGTKDDFYRHIRVFVYS